MVIVVATGQPAGRMIGVMVAPSWVCNPFTFAISWSPSRGAYQPRTTWPAIVKLSIINWSSPPTYINLLEGNQSSFCQKKLWNKFCSMACLKLEGGNPDFISHTLIRKPSKSNKLIIPSHLLLYCTVHQSIKGKPSNLFGKAQQNKPLASFQAYFLRFLFFKNITN